MIPSPGFPGVGLGAQVSHEISFLAWEKVPRDEGFGDGVARGTCHQIQILTAWYLLPFRPQGTKKVTQMTWWWEPEMPAIPGLAAQEPWWGEEEKAPQQLDSLSLTETRSPPAKEFWPESEMRPLWKHIPGPGRMERPGQQARLETWGWNAGNGKLA